MKNVAMQRNVMMVELLEDFPSFESAIERFMSCTHKALHLPVFFQVHCTLGALDVVSIHHQPRRAQKDRENVAGCYER